MQLISFSFGGDFINITNQGRGNIEYFKVIEIKNYPNNILIRLWFKNIKKKAKTSAIFYALITLTTKHPLFMNMLNLQVSDQDQQVA